MDYYGEDSDPDDDAVQAAHQLRSLAGEFWTRRLSCLLVLRNRRIPCGAPLSAGRVGKTSFFRIRTKERLLSSEHAKLGMQRLDK